MSANPTVHIDIVDAPIDLNALTEKVSDPDVGAHGWFVGVTRRTTDDRITETLDYEAHRPMAIEQLGQIARQAIDTYSLAHVVIVHRIGRVPVGEASIVVGCSSAHRVDTFAALPWMMDAIKRDVPIWKRETYTDGQQEWVHPDSDSTPNE
ncbi:Molybdopterin synthase catalytic subunit [Rubripirellula tenax]|uniref:Molybdopterin synthase catalytic subunit n=1 Tax=Rubripirellula tenax TaxID=2528015 RepID=A0A5C6FCA4_9BACT|nr:molybdenum cofactor biosynthesis protein MoaE [Rubripirellula tenax]TWU58412.1 Molybdopterin synthase catalytic subunit [Rubripirellula tenax]